MVGYAKKPGNTLCCHAPPLPYLPYVREVPIIPGRTLTRWRHSSARARYFAGNDEGAGINTGELPRGKGSRVNGRGRSKWSLPPQQYAGDMRGGSDIALGRNIINKFARIAILKAPIPI